MTATARAATVDDIPALATLYQRLEAEMIALKPIWSATDGLPAPIDGSLATILDEAEAGVIVGELDGVPLGFLVWRHSDLHPQAAPARIATIELIFTEFDARRVGIGEAMMDRFLSHARSSGIGLFDGVAPPGHRHAKNFFESNGFKARRIVMHRDDE